MNNTFGQLFLKHRLITRSWNDLTILISFTDINKLLDVPFFLRVLQIHSVQDWPKHFTSWGVNLQSHFFNLSKSIAPSEFHLNLSLQIITKRVCPSNKDLQILVVPKWTIPENSKTCWNLHQTMVFWRRRRQFLKVILLNWPWFDIFHTYQACSVVRSSPDYLKLLPVLQTYFLKALTWLPRMA